MIQLVLVLIVGCALLLIAGLLARDAVRGRRRSAEETKPEDAACYAVSVELPSRVLMDRIFAEDDLTFVTGEGVRSIQRQFLRERRRIALSWLSRTRREATRVLRMHLHAVRTDLALHPLVEVQLVVHTLLFFMVYAILWALVGCYGAFWARSFLRNVLHLTGSLTGLGGSILADAGRSGLRTAASHGNA